MTDERGFLALSLSDGTTVLASIAPLPRDASRTSFVIRAAGVGFKYAARPYTGSVEFVVREETYGIAVTVRSLDLTAADGNVAPATEKARTAFQYSLHDALLRYYRVAGSAMFTQALRAARRVQRDELVAAVDRAQAALAAFDMAEGDA